MNENYATQTQEKHKMQAPGTTKSFAFNHSHLYHSWEKHTADFKNLSSLFFSQA